MASENYVQIRTSREHPYIIKMTSWCSTTLPWWWWARQYLWYSCCFSCWRPTRPPSTCGFFEKPISLRIQTQNKNKKNETPPFELKQNQTQYRKHLYVLIKNKQTQNGTNQSEEKDGYIFYWFLASFDLLIVDFLVWNATPFCVLWTVSRGTNGRNFDGVERPTCVIK